jgi:hypothetical protein
MLRIPHCLDNRLTVNCEILREREEFRMLMGGGAVRGTTKMLGSENNKLRLEGSQALPASPSGRVGFD